jgi:hypothetical protein
VLPGALFDELSVRALSTRQRNHAIAQQLKLRRFVMSMPIFGTKHMLAASFGGVRRQPIFMTVAPEPYLRCLSCFSLARAVFEKNHDSLAAAPADPLTGGSKVIASD